MQKNVKIIMHTHWDREWYFTQDETKTLLSFHMLNVINFLNNHQEATYVLDGQSILLDDFIELLPQYKKEIEKLVKNGQLKVGPWYTQTDLRIVNGESVIRNLYYGIKKAFEYRDVMKIGYAPDTFGHSGQMPQIYKGFGINSSFFWRGFSEMKNEKCDFIWEGVDGTKIIGVNLATGYQGAKYLETDEQELKNRVDKLFKVLDKVSTTNQRLLMNGHDQMPVQENIYEVISKLKNLYPDCNFSISTFEDYVNHLIPEQLTTVKGELIHSKHARIHKTINSTRMDIKLLNTEVEYRIYNILEPLSIIASTHGMPYPHNLIEHNLKKLFAVHAHDSMGGCNSDKVNRDIKQRLLSIKESINSQIDLVLRHLAMDGNIANPIVIVNCLPYKRKNQFVELETITRTSNFNIFYKGKKLKYNIIEQDIIDGGTIDRQITAKLLDIKVFRSKISLKINSIDGLSYTYLNFKEGNNYGLSSKYTEENYIENGYYKLFIEENSIKLYNKITKEIIENVIAIENSGDDGDSYDYSPPKNNLHIYSNDGEITELKVIKNENENILKCTIKMCIPETQKDRENMGKNLTAVFSLQVSLQQDNLIRCQLKHINKAQDTRFRLVFKTGVLSNYVETDSFLSTQIKPIYNHDELEVWEKEKWAEKPVSIETFNSYVSLYDEQKTKRSTIISSGLKEYEVIEDKIYITLFRTFSKLGKRNLINRPGRASGIEIDTPDNQLINVPFDFNFAFAFTNKINSNDSLISKNYLTPVLGYQLKEFNRFNINKLNNKIFNIETLNLDLNGAVISTVQLTEDNKYIFIRMFNPTSKNINLEFKNKDTYLSNMFMEKLEQLNSYQMAPQKILNIILNKNVFREDFYEEF